MELLKEMRPKGHEADVITCNADIICAIRARCRRGCWSSSERGDEATGLEPDVITHSAVISTCKKGQQAERALELPEEMLQSGLVPQRDHLQRGH